MLLLLLIAVFATAVSFFILKCMCNAYFRHNRLQYENHTKMYQCVAIVTGGNAGIGLECVRDLLRRGATVVLACRRSQIPPDSITEFPDEQARCHFMHLELSSFRSVTDFVERFSKKFKRLDLLINNAGVFYHPFELTMDGFEIHMQVNHLSHLLLTLNLIPLMQRDNEEENHAIVVNVTSLLYKYAPSPFKAESNNPTQAYANSKFAMHLINHRIYEFLQKEFNIRSYLVHPGVVKTSISRHIVPSRFLQPVAQLFSGIFFRSAKYAAKTITYLGVAKTLKVGAFFYDGEIEIESDVVFDRFSQTECASFSYKAIKQHLPKQLRGQIETVLINQIESEPPPPIKAFPNHQ